MTVCRRCLTTFPKIVKGWNNCKKCGLSLFVERLEEKEKKVKEVEVNEVKELEENENA